MASHLHGISSTGWPNEKRLGFCVENEPNMLWSVYRGRTHKWKKEHYFTQQKSEKKYRGWLDWWIKTTLFDATVAKSALFNATAPISATHCMRSNVPVDCHKLCSIQWWILQVCSQTIEHQVYQYVPSFSISEQFESRHVTILQRISFLLLWSGGHRCTE